MMGVEQRIATTTKLGSRDLRDAELQRASDFQAALLGMAGHDLRQPLQVIQSAYEWLGSPRRRASEKARLERGERAIARLTEQLDRLVGALRLYEHARSMEMVAVALAPLLWRIGARTRRRRRTRASSCACAATTAAVMSNPVLLDGILRNLVRNAVKYTRAGRTHPDRLPSLRPRRAHRCLRHRHRHGAGASPTHFRGLPPRQLHARRRPWYRPFRGAPGGRAAGPPHRGQLGRSARLPLLGAAPAPATEKLPRPRSNLDQAKVWSRSYLGLTCVAATGHGNAHASRKTIHPARCHSRPMKAQSFTSSTTTNRSGARWIACFAASGCNADLWLGARAPRCRGGRRRWLHRPGRAPAGHQRPRFPGPARRSRHRPAGRPDDRATAISPCRCGR